jgi:hypothetical protein
MAGGPSLVDDAEARCVLQRAQGAIQKWPEGFGGFRARIRVRARSREAVGLVTVKPRGYVETEIGDGELDQLVIEGLGNLSELLTPRFFKDGDGQYPIAAGPDDGHFLGRLVQVRRSADEMVAYRIDSKGRVRLEEYQGRGRRVVTVVHEYLRATPGRVLPGRVQVTSCDLEDGRPERHEEIVTTFRRVGHIWLPESRLLAGQSASGRHSVLFELSRHRLA